MKLSRITSGRTLIPEIDGLRFIAIGAVVAFHIYEYAATRLNASAPGIVTKILLNGQRGVPLFFVISGFILGYPFALHYIGGEPAPDLKRYFIRRLTRLEPPYIVALSGVFAGLWFFTDLHALPHLFASLGYAHNLIYGKPNPFYSLAWSLEIEVQFYCLLPVIALIYKLPRALRRTILFVLLFAGAINLIPLPGRIHLSLLGWTQCFAAGLLLADLYVDGWNAIQHWAFDLISVLLWPTVFVVRESAASVLLPAMALALYVSAFRSLLFHRFFTLSPIVIMGGMCYSIYLVHYIPISVVGHFIHGVALFTLVSLTAVGGTSLVFFSLIERPFMRIRWRKTNYGLSRTVQSPGVS